MIREGDGRDQISGLGQILEKIRVIILVVSFKIASFRSTVVFALTTGSHVQLGYSRFIIWASQSLKFFDLVNLKKTEQSKGAFIQNQTFQ